jgi:hypothetical protein
MSDFENRVLSDLAVLKAQMQELLGNGQPGRLRQLELRVEQHEAFMQRGAGIGALLAFLLTLLHVGIDFLHSRR